MFLIQRVNYLTKEVNRQESNYQNVLAEQKGQNSTVLLTFSEFKDQMSERLDSILKVAKIKPKQVQEITNVTNNYFNSDTTIIRPVLRDSIYPFIDVKDCFTIGGYLRVINDKPELAITERKFDNEIDIIGYWHRPHKFLFIKYGKRQYDINGVAKCGDVKVSQIKIIKK